MKKLIILFMLLLFVPIVFAQPPTQTNTNLDVGIDIAYPQFEYVKKDTGFLLHVQAYNRSDGLLLYNTSTDCLLHLYNSSGHHVTETLLEFDGHDFNLSIDKGNFSDLGLHGFTIYCNTTEHGGFANGVFEVTDDGRPPYEDYVPGAIILAIIIYLLIHASKHTESYAVKLFFYFLSLLLGIMALAFAVEIYLYGALNIFNVAYKLLIYPSLFVLVYIIIVFVYETFTKRNNDKEDGI